ncbi:hypothetical protein ABZX40_02030 [Streptomyces sp. NPDC004610]|uniref:hypothetical protein n=1 Tax=unclassified Streptomyces TaxID=2593676 RepID=UPI0033A3F02F
MKQNSRSAWWQTAVRAQQSVLNELTSSRCSGLFLRVPVELRDGTGMEIRAWVVPSFRRARQRVSEQDTTHVDDLRAAPGNAGELIE